MKLKSSEFKVQSLETTCQRPKVLTALERKKQQQLPAAVTSNRTQI